jgi:hypothetical protein
MPTKKKTGPVVLKSTRWRLVLGDPNDPENSESWAELEAQARSADEIRAEAMFRRNKGWGTIADSPLTFQQVQMWAALIRTNQIARDTTFDAFRAGLVEWSVIEDEDEETPTLPALAAG